MYKKTKSQKYQVADGYIIQTRDKRLKAGDTISEADAKALRDFNMLLEKGMLIIIKEKDNVSRS